jgi:hypothetical protein
VIDHHAVEKPTETVRILDDKGHEYTEKEIAELMKHDKTALQDIVNSLHEAEVKTTKPSEAFEIKQAEAKILGEAKAAGVHLSEKPVATSKLPVTANSPASSTRKATHTAAAHTPAHTPITKLATKATKK